MNQSTADNITASLIEYPCEFPLKVFGRQQDGFAQAVLEIVTRHAPEFTAANMEMRASRNARYISLTCTIHATSREQLDAVYRELCNHPMVTMVL